MTEIIKTDIAPGPKRRKTEKAVIDAGGTPVLLAYDEVNDRTVMVRGDILGGMRVMGMLYQDGTYVSHGGATQGGVNKAFTNTDNLEDKIENVVEQLKMLNIQMAHMTDIWLTKEDIDKE